MDILTGVTTYSDINMEDTMDFSTSNRPNLKKLIDTEPYFDVDPTNSHSFD